MDAMINGGKFMSNIVDKSFSEYKEIMKPLSLVSHGLKNGIIKLGMKDGQVIAYIGGNYFFIDDDRGLNDIEVYRRMFTQLELEQLICIALHELKDMYLDEYNYYLLCLKS